MSNAINVWGDVLMNTYGTPPIELVSGSGAIVTDADGNDYIDLLAGIAVNGLGQGHPAIVEAVTAQIGQLGHVSNLFASAPVVAVAAELKKRFGDDSARIFFCNSGGEANEAAFKLARLTGRGRVLAAEHGFHGRTMGSLALTGQPDKRKPFEPLAPGVEFYPYGDIEFLTKAVATNPSGVAAIFLEPIQGETGVIPAPKGFLKQVRDLCDQHGILMIVDEVQTGIGRTGDFFAHQHEGIVPDVITIAKGLGGGLPIGACLARGKAAQLFGPGSHGTTFGGNPVTCAAASAVLDVVDEGFVAEVRRKGEMFAKQLRGVDGVTDVRGRGLMLGVVVDKPIAKQAVTEGYKHGVILNAPSDTVLRLTPPLVITDDEITQATQRIASTLAAVASTASTETEGK
ncbi:acetylornithine transaminase [Corynebacterium cystitidis]|uniref:Acetylornithine aminotransferase n=1 Tax=Corynebacterium cystitidis DSM 20524 TaxID=1121357 RepID=A0A1H9V9X5_9CORY|nr:acetylornithine transaminase [Corynebacterium cystitidis]WJY82333.1 Acetylornithine aminotransferase [Corynebacterium cystitidis DSM 20524]SES18576.1 acetylornithine aminotransferase apoenzyme [Corynebacterium cystitidis DSM 20524]SNV76416.1 acetylornithine aminotransferase [Corynebacterium cystitidis]